MSYQQPQQGGQQQSETEVVSGQVASVITKGPDKWQIAVNTGGQYTKNLWTKDAGLVNQMMGAIGQSFDFVCGVSHWTGQSGPVRSLWINGLANYGSSQQGQPGGGSEYNPGYAQQPATQQPVMQQPVPQQQYQQPQQPMPQVPVQREWQPATANTSVQGMPTLAPLEKEERIMREHAMSVAATMLPYMEPTERNFLGMVNVSEGLIRYYKLGPPPNGSQQQPQQQPVQAGAWQNDPGPEQGDPGPGYGSGPAPGDGPEWPS